MSVQYIPAPDYAGEMFQAWKSLQELQAHAQELAINQAMAQQHIQNYQSQKALTDAQTQIEAQRATEFTDPTAIQQRKDLSAAQVQKAQSDALGSQLEVASQATMNPLKQAYAQMTNQGLSIANQSAQKNLDYLGEQLSNRTELEKLHVQGLKYDMIKNYGTNGEVADQLAKLQAPAKVAEISEQVARASQIQTQTKAVEQQMKTVPIREGLDLMRQAGSPAAAKQIASALGPGYEWMQNLSDSVTSPNDTPEKAALKIATDLAQQGKSEGMDYLTEFFAKSLGQKPQTPEEQLTQQMISKKMGIQTSNPTRTAAQKLAEAYVQSVKEGKMPAGSPMINQGSTQFGIVPGMTVQQGTQNLGPIPGSQGGSPAPSPTPAPPTPSPRIQSGTMQLEGDGLSQQSLSDSETVLQKLESALKNNPDGDKGYVNNKDSSLVSTPYDESYTVSPNGIVYNAFDRQKTVERVANARGPQGGHMSDTDSGLITSSIPKDMQDVITANIKHDTAATTGQEARYRTIIGLFGRAYAEGGLNGLRQMAKTVGSKYEYGKPDGITSEQALSLAAIIKSFGVQKDAQSK